MHSPASHLRLIGLGAVLLVVPFGARAQDNSDSDWNHLGLNFRAAFNISAKFSEPSAAATLPPGPGAGTGLDHQYNDGYVNVDSSGNHGGVTWNWGYQHASQISGGDVLMHADSGVAGANESTTGDADLGLDLNYVRDLGHEKWGQWGIKFGVGYTPVNVRDRDPMTANAVMITDKYALNGVVPPDAPYSGSFGGPGPVLGSDPISRTTSEAPGGAVIYGNRNIDAALFDFRLGPSVNIPLLKRLSLQASGGLAVGVVHSYFTFTESGSAGGPVTASGGNTHTGVVPGAYAEAGLAYRVCTRASVFTGVQFEYLGNFDQTANGRTAELDLGQTIFYELGLEFHF